MAIPSGASTEWVEMLRHLYGLNQARGTGQPVDPTKQMLMETVQRAMQQAPQGQAGPSGFQTALQYAKPAMSAANIGMKLAGTSATDLVSQYLPSMAGYMPAIGAAVGPALSLASGLASGQGDRMMYSVPTSVISAIAGPAAVAAAPAAIAGIGAGIHNIFESEGVAEQTHNTRERLGQAQAGRTQAGETLGGIRTLADLQRALAQPYGKAGTLGGVLRTMIEGNLSGKYLTPDTNVGGGEMYWEPNESFRSLLAAMDRLGIKPEEYVGDQGSQRISNVNELIAHSGGSTVDKEAMKYGPRLRPHEASGIANWNALLTGLSQKAQSMDPSLRSQQPFEWTSDRITNTVFSDPMQAYNESRTNPYFVQNFAGTPGKAARAANLPQQDEATWRQWRIDSGYRDPDDIAFLNRDNPDYRPIGGGQGGS